MRRRGSRTGVRILHCIPSMEGGGAERQLTYLAAELQRRGEEVHVAVVSRGPNWARLLATEATIHEMRASSPHDPRLVGQLVRIVRSVDPDVVQVWLRQMDILAGLIALVLRKPLVLTERSSAKAYPPALKHTLRNWIGRWASAIVSNSEEGNRYWHRLVRGDTPRYVIPNAIPVEEIALTPPALDLPNQEGRKLVLFAGRLEAEKNIGTLLEALDLTLMDDDVHVIFCGEGSRRQLIDDWIDRHGFQTRATLIGYVPTLWSIMKRASVLVSPSVFEGNPNVVLEAMACRCPLVVSDIPAHRAILNESAAILVEPNSATRLAAAIRGVLCDAAAARQRADAALARVRHFTPELIAQRYLDVYRRVVAQPAAAVSRGKI